MMTASMITGPAALPLEALADLTDAVKRLERETLTGRVTNLLGKQVELAGTLVPTAARHLVSRATSYSLRAALRTAIRSLDPRQRPASRRFHKVLTAASGAVGGAFGMAALFVELPASTVLILRSIADIARSAGENLHDPETMLACLEVFALGGRTTTDDHMGSIYFAVRGALAKTVTDAARFIAQKQIADETAPVLVRFLAQLAARYGVFVSQRMAAQAIPVLGAIGGAAVNYAFVEHFQSIAHGHFVVRRLERTYGEDLVHLEYERIRVAVTMNDPG